MPTTPIQGPVRIYGLYAIRPSQRKEREPRERRPNEGDASPEEAADKKKDEETGDKREKGRLIDVTA